MNDAGDFKRNVAAVLDAAERREQALDIGTAPIELAREFESIRGTRLALLNLLRRDFGLPVPDRQQGQPTNG